MKKLGSSFHTLSGISISDIGDGTTMAVGGSSFKHLTNSTFSIFGAVIGSLAAGHSTPS